MLLVAFGAPLQELFLRRNRAQLKCEVSRVLKLFLLEQKANELQGKLTEWEKNEQKMLKKQEDDEIVLQIL